MKSLLTIVALFFLGSGRFADAQAPAKPTILAGEEVRQLLVGHTISGDSLQFRDHYLVTFNTDGTVVGKSRGTGFKKTELSTDTGHWTLKGNEMCDVFQSWSGRCWQTAQGSTEGTYVFIAPGKVYNGEPFTVSR